MKPIQKKTRKGLLVTLLAIPLLVIGTVIVLNGTGTIQLFNASAYTPRPQFFDHYTEIPLTRTDELYFNKNFFKYEELYPIKSLLYYVGQQKKTTHLTNTWGGVNNLYLSYTSYDISPRGQLEINQKRHAAWFVRHNNTTKATPFPFLSHEEVNYYPESPYKVGSVPLVHKSWAISPNIIGGKITNCSKQYFATHQNDITNAFFWSGATVITEYIPRNAGTYFVSSPICLVTLKAERDKGGVSFSNIVDTRYDTKELAKTYAFQTGAIVVVTINHPGYPVGNIEKMYFTDNVAAYSEFSKAYCFTKTSFDPIHCKKVTSGYRGIDITKDGRIYNLFAFEQSYIAPVNKYTEVFTNNVPTQIRGGEIAYQWWRQTLTSKLTYWEIDYVDPALKDGSRNPSTYNVDWQLAK